jgi:hypothetical protein
MELDVKKVPLARKHRGLLQGKRKNLFSPIPEALRTGNLSLSAFTFLRGSSSNEKEKPSSFELKSKGNNLFLLILQNRWIQRKKMI